VEALLDSGTVVAVEQVVCLDLLINLYLQELTP
jgi:hypothetical protein